MRLYMKLNLLVVKPPENYWTTRKQQLETVYGFFRTVVLACDWLLIGLVVSNFNYCQLSFTKREQCQPMVISHTSWVTENVQTLWHVASCLDGLQYGHNRDFLLTHKASPPQFFPVWRLEASLAKRQVCSRHIVNVGLKEDDTPLVHCLYLLNLFRVIGCWSSGKQENTAHV